METTKKNHINEYLNLKWMVWEAFTQQGQKENWKYVSLRFTGMTEVYKQNR